MTGATGHALFDPEPLITAEQYAADKAAFDAQWKGSGRAEAQAMRDDRQREAQRLRAQGLSFNEIGRRLCVCTHTAKADCDPKYREHLRKKARGQKRNRRKASKA